MRTTLRAEHLRWRRLERNRRRAHDLSAQQADYLIQRRLPAVTRGTFCARSVMKPPTSMISCGVARPTRLSRRPEFALLPAWRRGLPRLCPRETVEISRVGLRDQRDDNYDLPCRPNADTTCVDINRSAGLLIDGSVPEMGLRLRPRLKGNKFPDR